jgi:hypothetical protein
MEELMAADARLDFYSKEKMEDVKKNVDIVIGAFMNEIQRIFFCLALEFWLIILRFH